MSEPSAERGGRRRLFRRCEHLRRRCIHGDEGWARMKVYVLRWWKDPIIHRQACLDCGRALDLDAICTLTNDPHQHRFPPTSPAGADQ